MIYALAVLLPFMALLLRGKIIQSVLCLILQVTLIGWIPAVIWAVLVIQNDNAERRHKEVIATLRSQK
ncbi:MAG: YqaE/Pmp3 family membrane protein [Rhabdaerophilum sp.]